MTRKGRGIAIVGGALAITVLLVTGFLLWEDIRWWWRMQGVVDVRVFDFFLDDHVVQGPGPIAQAVKATKQFIESLAKEKPSDVKTVGFLSEVAFFRSEDPKSKVYWVWLNHQIDSEHAVVDCMGTRYLCTLSAWFGYLRDVLRPLAPDLLAAWRDPVGDPEGRFRAAGALALVAPDTEGLVEFFRGAIEEKHNLRAIWFLGEMGPLASAAAPAIEAVIADPQFEEEIHTEAKKILKKIRGERR